MSTHCYFLWAITRLLRRTVTYLLVLPVMILTYPFTAVGNFAAELFYRWRG